MAYFSDAGAHCSHPYCRQVDYLPFTCNLCGGVFCLDHFKPDCHACPKGNLEDKRVIVCPECAAVVRILPGQDENRTFERHKKSDCRPDLYKKRVETKKCPVEGCRQNITSVNSYTCKPCRVTVCIRHRLPEDHACSASLRQSTAGRVGSKQKPSEKLSSGKEPRKESESWRPNPSKRQTEPPRAHQDKPPRKRSHSIVGRCSIQ